MIMKQKHYWIMVVIVILGILIIGASIKLLFTEDKITNQCINELNVFENIFGINGEELEVLSSECSTCSPWYTPIVANFNAKVIDINGNEYNLQYDGSCARHENTELGYKILSNENTEIYKQMKNKICTKFSDILHLRQCLEDTEYPPTINEFTYCINDYSKYIEDGIINIDEDWEYCSTEGWKKCEEWNSCGPTGPTNTSVCTPEYCKLSCLYVYSTENIRNKFIEVCQELDKVEDDEYVFSFKYPGSFVEIESTHFLK
jgi:hypothetical protein